MFVYTAEFLRAEIERLIEENKDANDFCKMLANEEIKFYYEKLYELEKA